ncbi:MAG: ABC transporter permease subunit [Azospirillum sp.]|nr:ABC transporter permease subunit [Azospirillum sp.]
MSELSSLFGFGSVGWGGQLVAGLSMTVRLAVVAFATGMALGMVGAWAKLSRSRALRVTADLYTTFVRGVPEILIVLLLFYGGASALRQLMEAFGHTGPVEINAFIAGFLALGFVNGAYSTEVFRGAILAVPKGQIEAAHAIGMSGPLVFRRVLFPQMMRYALPGLGNLWLIMLKDTALVSVIGLSDLLRAGYIAAGSTRKPFTFYIAVAVLFLVLTVVSMIAFYVIERRVSRGVRRG